MERFYRDVRPAVYEARVSAEDGDWSRPLMLVRRVVGIALYARVNTEFERAPVRVDTFSEYEQMGAPIVFSGISCASISTAA